MYSQFWMNQKIKRYEVTNMENEEMKEPKEKILRQETFKVDCPKQITIGDPSYFEEFSGKSWIN